MHLSQTSRECLIAQKEEGVDLSTATLPSFSDIFVLRLHQGHQLVKWLLILFFGRYPDQAQHHPMIHKVTSLIQPLELEETPVELFTQTSHVFKLILTTLNCQQILSKHCCIELFS